ncbi:MAG TPA: hypothetical protein GX707_01430 [Epulopiscium sp.]|nr:hypothetical protein [Candidatus Epulonipiscium sp.]
MKDNIYTIPLTDAFHSGHECPFCFIHNNLQNDAMDFILGSAYMADDIREETNRLGFCSNHYGLLYDHGNRLGLAMMMHTHLVEFKKNLLPLLKNNNPKQTASKISIFTKKINPQSFHTLASSNNTTSEYIFKNEESCYVCNKIDGDMARYLDTFFFVWKRDPKFKDLVINCKGFCLSHFASLLDMAPLKLSGDMLQDFYQLVIPLTLENLNRIEEDLSWYIDKSDYRNKEASWKTSKDAIPRSIQKLASLQVGIEPKKEKGE